MIHYSDKIDDDKIIILINEVKAKELNCPFPLFHIENPNDELLSLGFNLISIEDDNKTHYWIERDDESKLAPLGYKAERSESYFL